MNFNSSIELKRICPQEYNSGVENNNCNWSFYHDKLRQQHTYTLFVHCTIIETECNVCMHPDV